MNELFRRFDRCIVGHRMWTRTGHRLCRKHGGLTYDVSCGSDDGPWHHWRFDSWELGGATCVNCGERVDPTEANKSYNA